MSLRRLIVLSLSLFAGTAAAHADTFTLANAVGASPTFSVTSAGGNTATFSSLSGNGFTVQNTLGLFSFATGLVDNNFFGTDPLTVAFSRPLTGTVQIPFGILDFFGGSGDTLLVTTNTGQTATFTGLGSGTGLSDPQGTAVLQLTGATQSLTLSSNQNLAFAVGDIVTVAPTPEPGSLVLLVTGTAALLFRYRRTSCRDTAA